MFTLIRKLIFKNQFLKRLLLLAVFGLLIADHYQFFVAKAAFTRSTLPGNVGADSRGLITILCGILNAIFNIFIVLAIALVLYAAFLYLTAGGSPEQVNKATKTLTFAAVAILVAILAKGFPLIIGKIIGVDISQQCGPSPS